MFFLLLLMLLLLIVLYSWISLIIDSKKISIPGPFPLPIIGNGHLFLGDSTDFLKTLQELAATYNGVSRFYIISNRYIHVTNPKFIEAVTSSNELINKGRSYDFLYPWLGDGLLTASGPRWKKHRKFLTPAFHFNILQNFLPIFLKNEKILTDKLKKLANGTEIDLFPLIALAALDNVTESIMGVSFNAQIDSESKYVKSIEILSGLMAKRMRNPFLAEDLIFNLLPHKKIQDKALNVLHGHSKQVIEARQRELESLNISNLKYNSEHGIKNNHAFLDLLLLAEVDGKRIDSANVQEEVDTFMFEGHDTTTSGIVFSLYCISRHKEVQERIFEEQKTILGNDLERDPSYSELKEMKYLAMVIKESLRLYPSVPLIERMVTRDTEIAGVFVPKDTAILIDIIHMQRNPDVFENPLEFQPQRFDNSSSVNPFHWLVFSAGARNCIGQKFAIMEMKVVLAAIVKKFIILPCGKEPVVGADLILRSKNGVYVKLVTR